ncbi:MAG: cyclodeaminase [Chloroflexota bacterium]
MSTIILTENELRQSVQLDLGLIEAIEEAFSRLAQGGVVMPPIMRVDVEEYNGELDIKSAYVPGLDSFAVKMSSGFFDNHKLGLPSLSGLMILFSARTGRPEAVLLDNGYLTDVRTGAAGAVAARHLAPRTITTAGVIGAGTQARYQMIALQQVRPFQRLLIYSQTESSVKKYIADMSDIVGVDIIAAASPEQVVRESEVVVTTTPSRRPLIQADWLHPGLHITAMGSDAEVKQELAAEALLRADLLVCDRKSQAFRLGELHHALKAGLLSEDGPVVELGEVTAGLVNGRTNDSQITICDLTGTGVQDTAVALLAYQRATQQGMGVEILR